MPCFSLGRKGWPFLPASVSQKVRTRQGTGCRTSMYIHVHSCTCLYINVSLLPSMDVSPHGSVQAEEAIVVLGTSGGPVCTCVCSCTCTCMYVYRTIPYIPKSKEMLKYVNGGPGIIYFFASGLLGRSSVYSLPSRLQALLSFPDDGLSFWKPALGISRRRRSSEDKQEFFSRWFIEGSHFL